MQPGLWPGINMMIVKSSATMTLQNDDKNVVAGLVLTLGVKLNAGRAACLLQDKCQLECHSNNSHVSRHTKAVYAHHQQRLMNRNDCQKHTWHCTAHQHTYN